MEIITVPEGADRAAALIRAAAAETPHSLIVCADYERRAALMDLAWEMGLEIRQPITFREFLSGYFERPGLQGLHWHARRVFIEDVDLLLASIAGEAQVAAVTLTKVRGFQQDDDPLRPDLGRVRELLGLGADAPLPPTVGMEYIPLEQHQRPDGVTEITRMKLTGAYLIPRPEEGEQDAS